MSTIEHRRRLLLLAYYCNPDLGSESATGWNHAVACAEHFDTWVISHGENRPHIDSFLRTNGEIAGLRFEYVQPTHWGNRALDSRWFRWLATNRWHRGALGIARRLHGEFDFELIHHITPQAYREPGFLWQLDAPFVWGPVGGTPNFPWAFLPECGLARMPHEAMRNIANTIGLRFNRRIKAVTQRAAALIVPNLAAQAVLQRVCGIAGEIVCDVGSKQLRETPRLPQTENGPLRIIWSGQLVPRKALSLLLKALAKVPSDVGFELQVLGDGVMRRRWQRLAERLGINDRIAWMGWIPYAQALEQYAKADVFAFTSLRDTSGSVVFEAMSSGLPVICLDHQGVHDYVTELCGIKVPVTNRRQVVSDLSDAVSLLARNPRMRATMSAAAIERARDYHWHELISKLFACYRRVWQERSGLVGDSTREFAAATSEPQLTNPLEYYRVDERSTSAVEHGGPHFNEKQIARNTVRRGHEH